VQGSDANVTLPLGENTLTLKVEDTHGQNATDTVRVAVRDTVAPTLAVVANPAVLWPPNHEMVPVGITAQVQDVCDPAPRVTLVSVASSEPDASPGTPHGGATSDIAGADIGAADGLLLLRAEREGSGPGRTYRATYTAVDASGNATTADAFVTVPHDQASVVEPLILRLTRDATSGGAVISWSDVPGALGYDVIAGDLRQARIENNVLSLGAVRVLARRTTVTSLAEDAAGIIPETGSAVFYLVESRAERGGVGYGSGTAPWPRVPSSCEGGCP
jgi:hypothetical protein